MYVKFTFETLKSLVRRDSRGRLHAIAVLILWFALGGYLCSVLLSAFNVTENTLFAASGGVVIAILISLFHLKLDNRRNNDV